MFMKHKLVCHLMQMVSFTFIVDFLKILDAFLINCLIKSDKRANADEMSQFNLAYDSV